MKKIFSSLIMAAVILLLYHIPVDVHAQAQTSVYLPSQSITIKNTHIESDRYYYVFNNELMMSEDVLQDKYLYYDAATGVLKLNNFDYGKYHFLAFPCSTKHIKGIFLVCGNISIITILPLRIICA